MDQDRSPIWAIPRGEIAGFFGYFTMLNIARLSFVGFHEYHTNGAQGVWGTIRVVIANAGSVTVGSAGIAIVASELSGWIVVLAGYFRDKFVEPQREKYRDQGRKEVEDRWREWNQRRLDAQEKGEEFNEAPPGEAG